MEPSDTTGTEWVFIVANTRDDFDLDLAGAELVSLGCGGVEHLSPTSIKIFLQKSSELITQVEKYLIENCFDFQEISDVDNTAWVTSCEALQAPVESGNVIVIPKHRAQAFNTLPGQIRVEIEYGLGFGTGHHASTREAMGLMQRKELFELPPKSVLDVGTGSGILAIVAHKLFDVAIEATECDPDAAKNAEENFSTNQTKVSRLLVTDALTDFAAPFDLVIANIYAEVLVQLEKDFYRLLKNGGNLLLAGIAQDKLHQIEGTFTELRWQALAVIKCEGWVAMMLRRRI